MKQLVAKTSSFLGDWLDSRTGYRKTVHEALYENIPGGSRWIYVSGSMLVCAFMTQLITGIFLWMAYSPGSQNAWESVYYLQNEMQGGWLLRGVHHFMAQAMVVLLPLHLAQVVLCRAYVAPREINYWLGLILMLLVLGLGLTGYLLPWDQKGYWATKVATELMSLPPGGAMMQKLVVGGREYGHATLTRFFALHAGVLPGLLVAVLALHVALFRKHGITAKSSIKRADEFFWPMQVFKDAVACGVLLAAVIGWTIWKHGAELGPPAEPTESYGAARPEWYFLFLFQLLKKFKSEFVGAIVVPTLVMAFLFAMPLIAKVRYLHWMNVLVIITMLVGVGYLTYEAIDHDNYHTRHPNKPADQSKLVLHRERTEASIGFHEAQEQSEREYERMTQLVEFFGIPKEGAAVSLVRNDPEIQGPRLFRRNCASCHSYLDADGKGIRGPVRPTGKDGKPDEKAPPFGAPNLYGFATREWFQKILDPNKIMSDDMFGGTKHSSGEMATFVMTELGDLDEEQKKQRDLIAATLSAEASLVGQRELDAQLAKSGDLEKGREAVTTAIKDQACTDCHKFGFAGELGAAPDLTRYGSREWLRGFIANPNHERFYGDKGNDRMPAFATQPGDARENLLSDHDMDMLVRWLRGDDRELTLKVARTTTEPKPATDKTPKDKDDDAELKGTGPAKDAEKVNEVSEAEAKNKGLKADSKESKAPAEDVKSKEGVNGNGGAQGH